jgi:hypothetical protein
MIKYDIGDSLGHGSFDDMRILCTDYNSYLVKYSRSANSMYVLSMPKPDESMQTKIMQHINDKLNESNKMNKTSSKSMMMMNSMTESSENGLGLEEVPTDYNLCPWLYATNVSASSMEGMMMDKSMVMMQ